MRNFAAVVNAYCRNFPRIQSGYLPNFNFCANSWCEVPEVGQVPSSADLKWVIQINQPTSFLWKVSQTLSTVRAQVQNPAQIGAGVGKVKERAPPSEQCLSCFHNNWATGTKIYEQVVVQKLN